MNLKEAIAAMVDGKKVKLPEWGGYWFVDAKDGWTNIEDEISAFTKNGDVFKRSAWVDKYRHRDDFEITDGALGFDFAILAMKNGKKVRRASWGSSIRWVRYIDLRPEVECILIPAEDEKYVLIKTGFAKLNGDNELEFGWVPSAQDMLDINWEIVEE